jgi:hypothetical protein
MQLENKSFKVIRGPGEIHLWPAEVAVHRLPRLGSRLKAESQERPIIQGFADNRPVQLENPPKGQNSITTTNRKRQQFFLLLTTRI